MSKRLTPEEKDKQRAERERIKNRGRALKYRGTVCAGCRSNYYNYQNPGNGWDAPSSGDGCWHLGSISRGKCPCRS